MLFLPHSYAADAVFLIYVPHAYAADTYLQLQCIFSRHAFFLSTALMHVRPIRLQAGIFLSTTLSHTQPTSPKTPMNNLNNPILLLFRHLVIAGKAKPSTENIGSYINSRAFYVSICASSTVALNCDEGVCSVYRLHMHGL